MSRTSPMVTVRLATEADSAGIAKVHVETWKHAYTNILPEAYLHSLEISQRLPMWLDILRNNKETVFVAEAEAGTIVGFAACGPFRGASQPHEGELYSLYILPGFQRLGLGRKLVQRASAWLSDRGVSSLSAWVLRDNPAVAFYKHLGAKRVAERSIQLAGDTFLEWLLAWEALPGQRPA